MITNDNVNVLFQEVGPRLSHPILIAMCLEAAIEKREREREREKRKEKEKKIRRKKYRKESKGRKMAVILCS